MSESATPEPKPYSLEELSPAALLHIFARSDRERPERGERRAVTGRGKWRRRRKDNGGERGGSTRC